MFGGYFCPGHALAYRKVNPKGQPMVDEVMGQGKRSNKTILQFGSKTNIYHIYKLDN